MRGRAEVLTLYRRLIQSSSELRYTNQEWFINRVRGEFRQSQHSVDTKMIEHQFEKGEYYLAKRPLA